MQFDDGQKNQHILTAKIAKASRSTPRQVPLGELCGCFFAPFALKGLSRSEEHTSELQSRQYLHSFPTRRSSDLMKISCWPLAVSSFDSRGIGCYECNLTTAKKINTS